MKRNIAPLLKEPLVHFLVAGCLLFWLFESIGQTEIEDTSKQIAVSEEALLNFVQLRAKTLRPDAIREQMQRIPPDELRRLIDNFVRDEALYREARSLGLDENDIGVRQSLIRKLEFINQGIIDASISLDEDELRDFYQQHSERYLEPPTITLTHVFFNSDRHGEQQAQELARSTLDRLNGISEGEAVPFSGAPGFGDRFLYRQNYVGQELDEIKSHFGPEMQESVFALEPDGKTWHGPFRSHYGYHNVLVAKKTDRRLPPFEELRRRIEADAFQAKLDEKRLEIEDSVIETYDVVLDESLQQKLKSQPETQPESTK